MKNRGFFEGIFKTQKQPRKLEFSFEAQYFSKTFSRVKMNLFKLNSSRRETVFHAHTCEGSASENIGKSLLREIPKIYFDSY